MGVTSKGEKRPMDQKKDEGISWNKLGRMGMMGKWMETRAQIGVG
jgi:hypothetical protein